MKTKNDITDEQLAKQYFEFPLKVIRYSCIYTNDDKVVFSWRTGLRSCDEEKFIQKLNTGIGDLKQKFKVYSAHILCEDGQAAVLIRSWGRLTGIDGYNLPSEKAAAIQTAMLNYCCEQLNK